MVSYGDTVMPNGLTYSNLYPAPYGPDRIKYYRIDTLYRIQEYYSYLESDTCGGLYNEVNIFRLNAPDSSYWNTCFNIGENLFSSTLRYMGEFILDAFGKKWEGKYFAQYNKIYDSSINDTLDQYGGAYILLKGLGIYYTEFGESSSATLDGAIINGVKYGTLVGVEEKNESKPESFTLYQNYPNPFNSQTVITFILDKTQQVTLEVYNVLGQKIAALAALITNS